MRHSVTFALFLLINNILASASYGEATKILATYYGTSDASAAVAVGKEAFVVADDENNVLRIYTTNLSSQPVSTYDLAPFLDVDPNRPEVDIEGATVVGDLIYWISSHGRNKDGKMRQNRYRFFATSVKVENNSVILTAVGTPCRTLVHEIIKSGMTQHLGLNNVTRFDARKLKERTQKACA